MIWISIMVLTLGSLLIKLGAMSVTLAVMTMALKAALALCVVFAGIFLWRHFNNRRNR